MAPGGAPRSKRAIQRFCQLGHRECTRVATELGEKYFITQELVDRRIKKVEQLHALSAARATGNDTLRPEAVAPLRDEARSDADEAEDFARLRQKNDELKDQNLNSQNRQ